MINLKQLFESSIKEGATNIYVKAAEPPAFLINNKVVKAKSDPLTAAICQDICYKALSNQQIEDLKKEGLLNLTIENEDGVRFKSSIQFLNGEVSAVFKRLLSELPAIKDLDFPPSFKSVINLKSGIVLFVGPKNSGKTTSLAAIIDYYNRNKRASSVTLESTIEYSYQTGKGVINQVDKKKAGKNAADIVRSYSPDIVTIDCAVGAEEIKLSYDLALSGALVFMAINAETAYDAIKRVTMNLEKEEKEFFLSKVSSVILQKLVVNDEKKLMPISEITFIDSEIEKALVESHQEKVEELIKIDRNKLGNTTINQTLMNHVIKRKIDVKNAFMVSPKPDDLDNMLKQAGF